MALESFGTVSAEAINHAVILCHDLIKEHSVEQVNEMLKLSDPPIWWVRAGYKELNTASRIPVVVIELGVG